MVTSGSNILLAKILEAKALKLDPMGTVTTFVFYIPSVSVKVKYTQS